MVTKVRVVLSEYWPFLLPVLVLLPGLGSFLYPGSGAAYSDMAITHYPNALFLQNALRQGEVPLWSQQILSGFPFVAHPYSGLWYPPYWLALLFPLPLGLNLVLAAHVLLAGVGMYCFLRQQGIGQPAATLGGLAFQAAPRLFAHIGAGHLMLVMAVCLTPWLLWASSSKSRLPASIFLALILVADPRWALYAAALWAAWLLWQKRPIYATGQGALGAVLALPALWLYWQYGQLSTRASLTAVEVLELSMPPSGLLGLLLPQWGGSHEWVIYPGVVLLLLVALARPWRSSLRFWFAVILVCILVALGSYVPGATWLAELPGVSQLRIPPRALLLASFAWAVLLAAALQQVSKMPTARRSLRLLHLSVLMLLVSFGVLAAMQSAPLWRPALFAAGLVLCAWLVHERWPAGRRLALALGALVLLDLLVASASLVRFRPSAEVLAEGAEVAQRLAEDTSVFRVYSPDYSLPQQTAATYGLELAGGVDPLQLQSYAGYLAAAGGYLPTGYRVALPPLDGVGRLDAVLLGRLNVKYIVSQQPLQVDGLSLQHAEPYIYLNSHFRPRAWLERGDEIEAATLLYIGTNRVVVHAEGPGLLVASEVDYPGWHVLVDRRPAQFATPNGLLRTVQLPAGEHEVEFYFMPDALRYGLPIAIAAWLISIAKVLRRRA